MARYHLDYTDTDTCIGIGVIRIRGYAIFLKTRYADSFEYFLEKINNKAHIIAETINHLVITVFFLPFS
uniref:Uncharacterized protein n=1 Tax=Arundo donax TaxID=35708 RepID=A0A0A9H360_ARUDO